MKKLIITATMLFSMGSFANIVCDGGGNTIEINESSRSLTISGEYNGVIQNLGGSGEEFSGSASEGDFRGLTINIDDGELVIIKKNGKRTSIIDVTCD